jgi:hypothetical protein
MDRTHIQNLFINPTMDISCRNIQFNFNKFENSYTLDRWGIQGSNLVVDQDFDSPLHSQANYCLKITKNLSEDKSKIIVYQKIEGFNLRYIKNKLIFFSGFFKTTVPGVYSVFLKNGDLDDICNSLVMKMTLPENEWTQINISMQSLPLNKGTWNFDNKIGLTFGIVLDHPEDSSKVGYTGNWIENSNVKCLNDQINFGFYKNAEFKMTQLQLHEGVNRVPFFEIYRDIMLEKVYCQRYFEVIDVLTQVNLNYATVPFKVEKRSIPKLSMISIGGEWRAMGTNSCYQFTPSSKQRKAKLYIDAEL